MPIRINYPGDVRAIGRVSQQSGEGAYRANVLNPLMTSDANRRVGTQLSLLDLVEGARRTNLQAQVSRSNARDQIQAAQSQAVFARQSQERMALFQAEQRRAQQQAIGQRNAQAAAVNFQRQQALGQDRFGQQQQLGQQGFGFDQQMQQQRDQALAERQQAQMQRRQYSAMIATLDPQAQGRVRQKEFEIQRFKDDQKKRPTLRRGYPSFEYEQALQGLEQDSRRVAVQGNC